VYTISIKKHELNLVLAALRNFQESCSLGTAGELAILYEIDLDAAILDIDSLCEQINCT
jgi:hypothetical protein